MEDTTMQDVTQGLFGEQMFTIIPNGIPQDQLEQVRLARDPSLVRILTLYSCANRLRQRMGR